MNARADPHPRTLPARGRRRRERCERTTAKRSSNGYLTHPKSSLMQNPGVLGAAALAGIDHERAFLQRHARQPAGHDGGAVASREHERPEIDMAWRKAFFGAGRAGRER